MIALERDVSATTQEYLHGLRLAFPSGVEVSDDGQVRVSNAGVCLEIRYSILPPRVIALLRLPRLLVNLRFTSGTPAEQQAMLNYMDRAMQRGGG